MAGAVDGAASIEVPGGVRVMHLDCPRARPLELRLPAAPEPRLNQLRLTVDASSAGASLLLALSVERGVRACDQVFGQVVWSQLRKPNRHRPVLGGFC